MDFNRRLKQILVSRTTSQHPVPTKQQVCSFKIDEYDKLTFSQLVHKKLINIIQLRLNVPIANKTWQFLQQWDWIYANKVGRDIEFVFRRHYSSIILTVGKQTVDMAIKENPRGCIAHARNQQDFVAGSLLSLLKTSLNTGHEMC